MCQSNGTYLTSGTHLGGIKCTGCKDHLLIRSVNLDLAVNKDLDACGLHNATACLCKQNFLGLCPCDDLHIRAPASRHSVR